MTKETRNFYDRKYRQNFRYYIDRRIRDFYRNVIKGKITKSKYEKILGYSISEFLNHIKSSFKKGMTLKNHGLWHIDHIKGRVNYSYNDFNDKQFLECWKLKNIQPLWKDENLRKKKKI